METEKYNAVQETLYAILFASGDPLETGRLAEALEMETEDVERELCALRDRLNYERAGVRLVRMEELWQLTIAPEYAPAVRKVLETRRPASLSQSLLETLAIVAYRGPCTRALVEKIRGVDSNYSMAALKDRGYIEEAGRLDAPGLPILYKLAPDALRLLGVESVSDLPPLPDEISLPEEHPENIADEEQPGETALSGGGKV